MFEECLEVFKRELDYDNNLILDEYIPADGSYIIVDAEGKIKNYQDINVDTLTPKNIIDLRVISAAKNIHDKRLLTKSFNKIIKYMNECDEVEYKGILSLVDGNNENLIEPKVPYCCSIKF